MGEGESVATNSEHARADIEFHAVHAPIYDEEVASEYALYDEWALVPFLRRFERFGPQLKVLDLGCGTGAVTLHLARRGFTVRALDQSPDMIAIAEGKVERAGLRGNVTFHVGDAVSLPFEPDEFDLVTSQRVLHHLPDIRPAFAEVDRVLKPGGWFYLSDGVGDWTPAARALRALWKAVLPTLRAPETLHRPPAGHEVLRNAAEFEQLLTEFGFSYERRFFTHVGMQRYLSTRQRAVLIKLLSAPWNRSSGDLFFAYARACTSP